jgi:hypothetical protein
MSGTRMTSSGFWTRGTAAVLLTLVWLGGCGPQSAANLRKKPHSLYSFEAPADCETVYDRIVRRARDRYRVMPMAAHQPGISAKLAPSRDSATITFWDSGRIGIRYILTADLRQIDPARTQIDIHYAARADLQEAKLWGLWANTPLSK